MESSAVVTDRSNATVAAAMTKTVSPDVCQDEAGFGGGGRSRCQMCWGLDRSTA